MKKACIISIGNELLNGCSIDTNTAWLARRLFVMNIATAASFTVPDEADAIVRALAAASDCGGIILVTGGLGPTGDDITRDAFAAFTGAELELRPELLSSIKAFFNSRGAEMPRDNEIQAYIPRGCEAMENPLGTAPGIFARTGGRIYALMPGVPSEMKAIFEGFLEERLKPFADGVYMSERTLRCFGAGESMVHQMLGDMCRRGRNPQVNCTVSGSVITLQILASAQSRTEADDMADSDEAAIRRLLGELVFGSGTQKLADSAGSLLKSRGETVATAESCTGGLIAKMLTDFPGASSYFKQGWVCYSNDAKITQLQVDPEIIERFGAVSEQTAAAMSRSARRIAAADYAVSVTGIAGPGGGSEEKPTGLVYIGLDSETENLVQRFIFHGDRAAVRLRTAQTALNMLRLRLGV